MADHHISDDRVHLTFCDGDGAFYQLSGDGPPGRMGPRARVLARALLDLASRNLDALDERPGEITFDKSVSPEELSSSPAPAHRRRSRSPRWSAPAAVA